MIRSKVLFVTPFMDYTGSRIFLWRFLKSFDRNLIDVAVYSHHYGELVNVMPSDIKLYFFHKKKETKYMYSIKRFWNRRKGNNPYLGKFLGILKKFKPEIVVVNTISPGYVAEAIHGTNIKLVTLVHELPFTYSLADYCSFRNLVNFSDLLIGCSTIVCKELKKMGSKNTTVQNCFIDSYEIQIKRNRQDLRHSLGIKPDEFVWVCSGAFCFPKGGDLFLNIVTDNTWKKTKFLWVGNMSQTGYSYYAEKIISTQSANKVIITGYKKYDEYYDYLKLGDGFLLLSHCESFSLTTLEALSVGLPALCYDCGGIKDFINEDNGQILKTRDTKEWIDSMRRIMQNEMIFDNKKIIGSVSHLTSQVQIPKMTDTILSVLK